MTKPTQMVKALFDSLSEECEVTLKHAQLHLTSARYDLKCEDNEQAAHDLDIAGTILICLGSKLRGETR